MPHFHLNCLCSEKKMLIPLAGTMVRYLIVIKKVLLLRLMRTTITGLLFLAIFWTSCNKEKALPPLTSKEIKQKVDSIMVEKNREIEAAGKTDLQLRMKIEVKVIADSFLNARLNKVSKDTLKK